MSDELLTLHDRTATNADAGKSLVVRWCSALGTESGCERYAASFWSELRLPIVHLAVPVALLGWIYFSGIGAWYLIVGSPAGMLAGRLGRWQRWALIGVGAAGLYGSLFFICIMAFSAGPWCAACLIVHGINFALLTVIAFDVFAKPRKSASGVHPPSPRQRWSPAIAIGVLIALVALLNRGRSAASNARSIELDLKPYEQMVSDARKHTDLLLAYYHAQPLVNIPPGLLMPLPFRHRLVVFTDLQCPACAVNAIDIDTKIKPLFGNSLTVEIRQFPLCTACNPFASSNVHPDACAAAMAAETARQLGGQSAFDSMVSALHSHYAELSPAIYDAEATRLHLPLDDFHYTMTGLRVRGCVYTDIELGHSLGVVSTPTLFLDGRRVPEMCLTDDFWQAVAAAPTPSPTTR